MKLGLVRHYKVITNENGSLSSEDFINALSNYDNAPVQPNGLSINSDDWDICYCSTLPRAVTTAESIYNKNIIKSDLLIEVPGAPIFSTKYKFPINFWYITARIAWLFNHKSQPEGRSETKKRAKKFCDLISSSGYQKMLIVAHGYFLHSLYWELRRTGFKGEVPTNIKNAILYELTSD